MAIVRPFHAMRFTDKAGKIKELCCPPYDIISEEQKKAYFKKNTHNIIRLELPGDKAADYKKAKTTLDKWLEEGILEIDEEPGFYIYEEDFEVDGAMYKLRGFVGRVFLYDFERGIILPHEETLSKAKEDRFKLLESTCCNFSPVFSLYEDEKGAIEKSISKLTDREPDKSFTDAEGVTHKLWACPRSTEVDRISANMAGKKLYIADGHHRYETALRYKKKLIEDGVIEEMGENEVDYIMMMLVEISSPGLVVFPTHRIIRSLPKFSAAKITAACGDYFDISTTKSQETAKLKIRNMHQDGDIAFALYDGKKYTLMKLKDKSVMKEVMPQASSASRALDVNVLHKLVLEKLMGIDAESMANGTNLSYTRSIEEAAAAVDSGEANCCFILNPTRVSEIGAVAAAGEKMPQKSTYFYPKLTTGLVMNKLDRIPPAPKKEEKKQDYVGPEAEFVEI